MTQRLLQRRPTARLFAVALTTSVLALAACSAATESADDTSDAANAAGDESAPAAEGAPGVGGTAIGFIFVGPKTDFGYNQAAFEGSEIVAENFGDLEVLTQENVPEDENAARVMEQMIERGAKIIFATSYGHLQAAQQVAADHPDVVVVQQGNVLAPEDITANVGTYFGTVFEPVYLAGIAAGAATESNKLGYVYAFGIPQTVSNINAFELGAKLVNPAAETYVVNTSSWCDPQKQKTAADSLIAQGVDVITQHQDCQDTIVKTAEAAGIKVVGYHLDASSLAPEGWLTGSVWAWGDLYTDIVQTSLDGEFTGSKFNANYRVGYQDGANPFVASTFGDSVTQETQDLIADERERISVPGASIFTGPLNDQSGAEKIPTGESLQYGDPGLEGMDWFVEGVVGELAS